MANPANNGSVVGRLASDPKVFENKDGSKTVLVSVYSDNDYKSGDGSRGSVAVPLEAYFSKDAKGTGLFPYLGKGDLVAATYSVRSNDYTDAAGTKHYGISLRVESVTGLESKATVEARRARVTTGDTAASAE